MAWFKFGKKDDSAQDAPFRARGKARLSAQAPTDSVEAMRQKAKFRLIGSVVLVLAGVVGFPMLFDSQPRPVAVDIPIEIPDKAKSKPLTVPTNTPSSPAPAAVVEDKASLSGKEEIIASGQPAANPASAAKPLVAASTGAADAAKAKAKLAEKAAADKAAFDKAATDKSSTEKSAADKASADKLAAEKAKEAKEAKAKAAEAKAAEADKAKAALEASRAKALLDGKPAEAKTAAAAETGRFIVQFGAFTDVAKSREVRQKVEKAGLKTYSQIAKTADGDLIRVRVGPFGTKDEADKAAAKIKALGLPASILTL
jgi:DedD protein